MTTAAAVSGSLRIAHRDSSVRYDIHSVPLSLAERSEWFRYAANAERDTSTTVIEAARTALPFSDETFDVVLSASVLEHAHDVTGIMREIARVLKPSGCSLHLYPERTLPIEPHIYVPFGGLIQSTPG